MDASSIAASALSYEIELPSLAEGSGPTQAPRPAAADLVLTLRVTDPDVLAELGRRRPGPDRDAYAAAALRVGVLALRSAGGQLDAGVVREAGQQLLADLRETLAHRAAELSAEMARSLTRYFDPSSGLVSQRLDGLVRDGGELERLLRAHVGDESLLARTLASHVGQGSALLRMLSPDEAEGLKAQIEGALTCALAAQSDQVLRQFSLDDRASALSRLVAEIRTHQGELSRDLKGQVDQVVGEFSLDRADSALSRLVGRVEATQRAIADQFSLDDAGSAMSRLSGLLVRTSEQIDRNLTLDDEDSALARLRRELKGTIDDLSQRNAQFHGDVRAALAALAARREEAARSTRHGATFEDAVGGLLAAEAQRVGDVYQATGTSTGAIKHCKVGDHVVSMGPDSAAPGVAIVFEAKEDRACDLRSALAEIDRARKNRGAQIGVFVVSAATAPDGLQPLVRYGDDIVVVWDADDPRTDLHVRCAYSMARGLATRVADSSAQSAEALRELDLATRAIEKQVQFLDEVGRMAGTVEGHGKKIRERTERMREDLAREVARLDDQVRALRAAP